MITSHHGGDLGSAADTQSPGNPPTQPGVGLSAPPAPQTPPLDYPEARRCSSPSQDLGSGHSGSLGLVTAVHPVPLEPPPGEKALLVFPCGAQRLTQHTHTAVLSCMSLGVCAHV